MIVTLRADDESIRIYYGGKLNSSHARHYGKHKIFTHAAHQAGLLERKGGGDHHTWQLTLVREAGESLAQYLKLIASGHRSLRSEVRRLVALITVYGAEAANQAATELLKRGMVGAESLEMLLKAQGAEEKQPEPMSFKSAGLNRMTGVPDLSSYDAYCFESDSSPATAGAAEPRVADVSPEASPSETTETEGETHDNQFREPDPGSH
jgi:hypothetical protein